jgi:hypothetical protein
MTELALVVILYVTVNVVIVIVGRDMIEPAYLTPKLNWR